MPINFSVKFSNTAESSSAKNSQNYSKSTENNSKKDLTNNSDNSKTHFSNNSTKPATKPPLSMFDPSFEDISVSDPRTYWKSIHSSISSSTSSSSPSTNLNSHLAPSLKTKSLTSKYRKHDEEDEENDLINKERELNEDTSDEDIEDSYKRDNKNLSIPLEEPASSGISKHGLFVPSGYSSSTSNFPSSRYIETIKHVSKKRELEQEIINEKKLKKELEADAQRFEGKEVFVSASYKKKLEERKQLQEELNKQEEQDAQKDVTKQNDLSLFHASLLASGKASRSNASQFLNIQPSKPIKTEIKKDQFVENKDINEKQEIKENLVNSSSQKVIAPHNVKEENFIKVEVDSNICHKTTSSTTTINQDIESPFTNTFSQNDNVNFNNVPIHSEKKNSSVLSPNIINESKIEQTEVNNLSPKTNLSLNQPNNQEPAIQNDSESNEDKKAKRLEKIALAKARFLERNKQN